MLTKKFTEFSADLLDTVAGILGEAKKCSDCGCAKCECEDDEDEDEMKESTAEYGKSIDAQKKKNITASDQNKISKLAAMMKAEKKPVKEESEQLDEYGLVIPRRDNLVSLKKHSFDNDFEDEMKKTRQTKKSVADAKKKYGVKEEAEQIDEWDISKMSHDKLKLHSTVPHGRYTRKEIQAEIKRRKSNGEYNSNYQAEEVEQLDELSKKTLGSYVKKAAGHAAGSAAATAAIASSSNPKVPGKVKRDLRNRLTGISKASDKLTKEEQEFIDALNADTLDEARGRPKKAGGKDFTIHPKTKEKLMHNNPEHMAKIEKLQKHGVLPKPKTEAGQHIINQLQKAKTSMTGGSTIHFTHGDSKHVSGAHAAKLLDKYAGMKPNEKEDFQKKIGHSHEQLMKHV